MRAAAVAMLLAGPTVIAFFAGGYFDTPRVWAGLLTWCLLALALLVTGSVPRSRPAVVALLAFAALAALTLLSALWAPAAGDAWAAGQRVVLYLGYLLAAASLLAAPEARRLTEPVLAAGILVVVAYGLSERMLPGVLRFTHSLSADGRLEQPLTYWNAMGEIAAIGFVLASRLAGDRSRPGWMRTAAVAASAPLGLGLYLSFSRGALFACAAGVVAVIVAAPSVSQLRALALALVAGVVAAVVGGAFGGVATLRGTLAVREQQGAIVLAALVLLAAVTTLAHARMRRGESDRKLALPRRAPLIALGLICAGLALAIALGSRERTTEPLASSASRLTSLQSDRYDYWRVAWRAFEAEPVHGVGAGGWAFSWLRDRPVNIGARDAHSLPLQTLAELGVLGLAVLLVLVGALVFVARSAHRRHGELAAGPIAGLVVYAAHAPLDWDWEMPALTLVALLLAGCLLALSGDRPAAGERRAAGDPEAAGAPSPARARRRGRSAPALLVLGAVLVVAWFGLGIRAFHDQAQVTALLAQPHISLAQARQAAVRLHDAALLNPDRTVDSLLARVDAGAGRHAAAVSLARRLTRLEPLNVNGWLLLSYLVVSDPTARARAEAHIRALVPPVPQ